MTDCIFFQFAPIFKFMAISSFLPQFEDHHKSYATHSICLNSHIFFSRLYSLYKLKDREVSDLKMVWDEFFSVQC